jgi:hypothetical protein
LNPDSADADRLWHWYELMVNNADGDALCQFTGRVMSIKNDLAHDDDMSRFKSRAINDGEDLLHNVTDGVGCTFGLPGEEPLSVHGRRARLLSGLSHRNGMAHIRCYYLQDWSSILNYPDGSSRPEEYFALWRQMVYEVPLDDIQDHLTVDGMVDVAAIHGEIDEVPPLDVDGVIDEMIQVANRSDIHADIMGVLNRYPNFFHTYARQPLDEDWGVPMSVAVV